MKNKIKKSDQNKRWFDTSIEIFGNILGAIREPVLVLDSHLKVIKANHSFYQTFNVKPDHTEGTLIYDLGNRQWNIPRLRELLEDILPENSEFIDFEVEHNFEKIGRKIMRLNARRIYRQPDKTRLILLAIEDVTEREYYKRNLEELVKHRTSELLAAKEEAEKKKIRELIFKIAIENSTWGAPRIYSEILMLGFSRMDISQRTVSRYLKKIRHNDNDPAIQKKRQQWKTFLENHKEQIMAMDFFTVPTVSFKILYVFFFIDHTRREMIHFNITRHPTSIWVRNQLRSAFPFDAAPKYLIFDRDSIFQGVKNFIKNEGKLYLSLISHLKGLLKEYVSYYNDERCHLSINRNTPTGREISEQTSKSAEVVSLPRIAGLHHRYEWRDAA